MNDELFSHQCFQEFVHQDEELDNELLTDQTIQAAKVDGVGRNTGP